MNKVQVRGELSGEIGIMKKIGILMTLIPFLACAQTCAKNRKECKDNDLFYVEDSFNDFLGHIEYENEDVEAFHTENQEKSESKIVSRQQTSVSPGLCEALDTASEEKISSFVEKRAAEINEEYEEMMGYDFPTRNEVDEYTPTFERVPEQQRQQLIGTRPRVVQDESQKCEKKDKDFVETKSMPLTSQKSQKKTETEEDDSVSR